MKYPLLLLLFVLGVNSVNFTLVTTKYGKLRGVQTQSNIEWRGIPFGASTANENRWKAPQKIEPWKGVKVAYRYGESCPQNCPLSSSLHCSNHSSENCLNLNVWAPLPVSSTVRGTFPVMFVIPGGEFQLADASAPIFVNGGAATMSNMSNSIVVIANYRIGPLGFLVTGSFKGNFGILDQLLALNWVKENIEGFGGDPNRVTIVGSSFGATCSAIHLTSSHSKNLFQGIIMQSNWLGASIPTLSQAKSFGAVLSNFLGCGLSDEQCLRSRSWQQIVRVSAKLDLSFSFVSLNGTSLSVPWGPTIDRDLIQGHPIDMVREGSYNSVPMIIGTAAEEGRMLIYRYLTSPFPNYEYIPLITAAFGRKALSIIKKYNPPYSPLSDTRDLLSKLMTDSFFTCPNRRIANLLYDRNETVFLYEFDHILQRPFQFWGKGNEACNYHICNGAEMPFIWSPTSTFSPTEKILREALITFWGNFVNRKNPNPDSGDPFRRGLSDWNVYTNRTEDADVRSYLRADTPNTSQQDLRKDECDWWDKISS
eukprot:TRINITY_DN3576_c0_g2_i1.p1 TRINITY_DN3576_c0_g2~~TRINITY_DN3576_c0_g2_i1.p1  ORF type:complete len:537 (-),score=129.42 TRINITY_DN3576_c0_g2_i1:27-1637(-)